MKSKVEPVSTRFKRFLEALIAYSFNLHSVSGNYITLSHFVSRTDVGKLYSHEMISISFNLHVVLQDRYCVCV